MLSINTCFSPASLRLTLSPAGAAQAVCRSGKDTFCKRKVIQAGTPGFFPLKHSALLFGSQGVDGSALIEELPDKPVSQTFRDMIKDGVATIDPEILLFFQQNRHGILLAPWMTDILPELESQQIPGYPPGATGKSLNGRYEPRLRKVLMAEQFINPWTGETWTASDNCKNVLRHEFGHAILSILQEKGETDLEIKAYLEAFMAAYRLDVDNLDMTQFTEDEKEEMAYYLPGENGIDTPEEEVFANLCGHIRMGLSWEGIEKFMSRFPESTKVVRKIPVFKPETQRILN